MFNQEFLEGADLVQAFAPVDLSAGDNNGDWVSLKNYDRCVAVLLCAVGTAGDDPVVQLEQAQDNAGSGAKPLNFTRIRHKVGATALAGVGQWTLVEQAAAAAYDTAAVDGAENEALVAVEVQAADLDVTGGFNYVRMTVPDVGAGVQLGCGFYVLHAARYKRDVNQSAVA